MSLAIMRPDDRKQSFLPRWKQRLLRQKLAGTIAFWAAAAILLCFTCLAVWPEAMAPYNPRLGRLADRHKPPGYVDAMGGVH
jgi:hypothetical protein